MDVALENQLACSFKSHSMCVLACVCADLGTLLCSCQNLTGMQTIKGKREGKERDGMESSLMFP